MAKFTRIIPKSSIGFQKAMTKAKEKKDGVALPADKILSATTSTRLDNDYAAFEALKLIIATKEGLYHRAIALARPQRKLLKHFVTDYFNRMNYIIGKGIMFASDRAFYGLDITNLRLPIMNTDDLLLAIAAKILSGDILRRAYLLDCLA